MSLNERLKYAEMKARHSKVLRPWYKKWWGVLTIILAIILFLLLAVASAYVANQVKDIIAGESTEQPTEQDFQTYLQAVTGDGTNFYTGPAEAKVTIIEFGDFSCPFCRESAPGLRRIAKEFENEVKVIYRDYPLHDNSIDLALAARCAGEQGQFWEMHDQFYLYKAPTEATGAELKSLIMSLVEEMKLDQARFEKCFDDRRYILKIKKDYDDGELVQIEGTPTWFVNNYMITGHLPEERLRELINGLLPQPTF